jgi:hypothetical protein
MHISRLLLIFTPHTISLQPLHLQVLSENLDLKFHYKLCPHILISQLAKIELLARSIVSSFVP